MRRESWRRVGAGLAALAMVGLSPVACASGRGRAQAEVQVFAASSLASAFQAAAPIFAETSPGMHLALQFAGSQQLRTQLVEGARADVFASADEREMQAVVDAGLVDPARVMPLASNTLVVILAEGNPGRIESVSDLARPGLKLALADPSVPVGRYTHSLLAEYARARGAEPDFVDQVWANAVSLEQSVAGVGTKVVAGEVDAGIVYRTDAVSGVASGLPFLETPPGVGLRIAYRIASLREAPNPRGAELFVRWVTSVSGQAILAEFGFLPAGEP